MNSQIDLADQDASCALTVIILTYNEELHIERCLNSLQGIAKRIVVIDSYSTDRTVDIAKSMGADVFGNVFVNQAVQLNWGIDTVGINTPWVFRLDADEVITPALALMLKTFLGSVPQSATGITVNRQIHFLGKWIKHGGIYPVRTLRIWRNQQGRCENRWMDEHIIVSGDIVHLNADIADMNLNNLTWWTNKHNNYASREAVEMLMRMESLPSLSSSKTNAGSRIKRLVKEHLYSRMPLGFRAFFYFIFRYIYLFGFLDGKAGIIFHFLQAFWYRFLIDAKMDEVRFFMSKKQCSLEVAIERVLSIKPQFAIHQGGIETSR